jgi:hypothetical protein
MMGFDLVAPVTVTNPVYDRLPQVSNWVGDVSQGAGHSQERVVDDVLCDLTRSAEGQGQPDKGRPLGSVEFLK